MVCAERSMLRAMVSRVGLGLTISSSGAAGARAGTVASWERGAPATAGAGAGGNPAGGRANTAVAASTVFGVAGAGALARNGAPAAGGAGIAGAEPAGPGPPDWRDSR